MPKALSGRGATSGMSNADSLPRGWYAILGLVFLAGVGLVCIPLPIPTGVISLSKSVRSDAWWRLLGILFIAIPVSHGVVYSCLRLVRHLFCLQTLDRRNLWAPAAVGVLESVMYPVAFLLNAKEFIGLWLLVKVAGQWPRWGLQQGGPGRDLEEALNEGRRRYCHCLIGNALQILLGLATYGILKVCTLA